MTIKATFSIIMLMMPVYSQIKTNNTKVIDQAKYICYYTINYQRDSTNKEDLRSERMLLLIGENSSRFLSENLLKLDSMLHDNKKRNVPVELAVTNLSRYPKTNFKYQIFKNYPEGKLTCFDRAFNDKFKYEEEMNFLNWKIEEGADSIAGLHCQKASTTHAGRDYVAWFSKEIPVNEGPYKFHGLPGLIVKVGDIKNHYVFELISITNVNDKVDIYFPIHYTISTTREGVIKAKYDANQNIIQRLEEMGARITDPQKRKELQDRAQKKARLRNNPMELK